MGIASAPMPRALKAEMIGHYGCASRLVKLRWTSENGEKKAAPRHFRLLCPACGFDHLVHPSWRKPKLDDPGIEVEITT